MKNAKLIILLMYKMLSTKNEFILIKWHKILFEVDLNDGSKV